MILGSGWPGTTGLNCQVYAARFQSGLLGISRPLSPTVDPR
jgi:hypothetical protein